MQTIGQISSRQFTMLVILTTVGDSILIAPSIATSDAKQDVWISMCISLTVGLAMVGFMAMLADKFPRQSPIEYARTLFGTTLGSLIGLMLLIYFGYEIISFLVEIGGVLTTQIMPETPVAAVELIFMAVIVLAVRLGLETTARTSELLFPWFVGLFSFLIIFLLPDIQADNLLPILAEGWQPVVEGSVFLMAYPFAELLCFLVIAPSVVRQGSLMKPLLTGAFIGGMILLIILLMSILVLGPTLVVMKIFSTYNLAQKISIGDFLERLEAILAFMWFVTIFFKTALYFYAINLGAAQWLKLKNYRVLTLPFAMILLALLRASVPNFIYYNDVIVRFWPFLDFTFGLLLPLAMLGMYALRRRRRSAQPG